MEKELKSALRQLAYSPASQVLGDVYGEIVFARYAMRDLDYVKMYVPRAIRFAPSLVFNRGFRSIVARAFLSVNPS